ncbi:MAG: hypothetical protein GY828_05460 [Candidatus Gracilibacteria bacterium]|nr:hypothetical protein [Candidatus Gracilibacteria bacterium]
MIKTVVINEKSFLYLKNRNLVPQYKKAKNYIVSGYAFLVSLKLREPKKKGIYYFRINKQYRAFALLEDNVLKVFHIDDHS